MHIIYRPFLQHQLSLFFDILLCLTTEINQDDYVAGNFISRALRDNPPDSLIATIMQRARAKLWGQIKDIKMKSSRLPTYFHIIRSHTHTHTRILWWNESDYKKPGARRPAPDLKTLIAILLTISSCLVEIGTILCRIQKIYSF